MLSDFEQPRDALAEHRAELTRAKEASLLAGEQVRQAERALAEYGRTASRRDQVERERLEAALQGAKERASKLGAQIDGLHERELGLVRDFAAFTDPRRSIGQWSDRYPILLFPLRLETRFKPGPAGQPQLCVRAYPDTCLIDTFESSLAEQEVTNARAFWAAIWRACGDEAAERTAWRDLVASHGSGRAGWIVRQYLPLNPGDKPAKINASDIFLIITAPSALPAAATAYWHAAWLADGNTAALDAAYLVLETAVGGTQAQEIVARYRPVNFGDAPAAGLGRHDVVVSVIVLQLTPAEEMATRRTSWSRPAKVELLPERLVLIGYTGAEASLTALGATIPPALLVSPDPNAPPERQLTPVDDTLQIPDEIAWMFNFEQALKVGMAFQLDLTPGQARAGFDRLVVLGVRLGDSPAAAKTKLEQLLEHHLHSRAGLEILPQGTPTNNTEKGGSGYSFRDDPEASFQPFFQQKPQYTVEADPLLRSDGEWLAQLLGLRHELAQRIPHAGGHDASEARAMQIALWSGTLGYTMKTLLAPIFSDSDIEETRAFFTRYVTGRGPLPILRIGKQPYGIFPATTFRRLNWFQSDRRPYAGRLYNVLRKIDDDWTRLLGQLSYVGKPGQDPHQALLDVLGLHPSAVEFHPLQADSLAHKYYELSFLDAELAGDLLSQFPPASPLTLLRQFGYAGTEMPELLRHVYRTRQTRLDGPVVDDQPLSETKWIRAYAGPKNYLEWLADAARTGIGALQQEQGFDGDVKPAALLYLLLRHALQLSFHETGVRQKVAAGIISAMQPELREPAFVHVSAEPVKSESRYDMLFQPDVQITGQPDLLLGDYIAQNITVIDPHLGEQVSALDRLSRLPTARLERLLAEHIDCCSYRLDAWKTGLVTQELERLSQTASDETPAGLFLGAFGWVEPLRPDGTKALTPATLPPELDEQVNKRDKSPLMRDASNGGLIHAPSLNHATTAAVLRNGYLANDGRLAVNLSSRRVRLALGILEGMRNGQSLGALLGYQFERHVHDNGPLTVRALVYPLRREFPLVAGQIAATQTDSGDAREAIAAMNVIDGRKLIEQADRVGTFTYPFGVTTLPSGAPAQESALTAALAYIRDINDAVADLVLAEGVHQAVLGNYERSAGTLDAFAKGNYPPEPDVIRTPRTGIGLTHRAAIHLPPNPPTPATTPTPLAAGEPAIEAWLASQLPAATDVGCNVRFTDRATDTEVTRFITQEQLGLYASDLLYRGDVRGDAALADLDERILSYLHTSFAPRYDRAIRIRHTEHVDSRVTWFELQALLRSLRSLLVASRPLRPTDLRLTGEATAAAEAKVSIPKTRITGIRDDLQALLPSLTTLGSAIGNAATPIDGVIAQFVSTLSRFAAYRLPQTGAGFALEWRAGVYGALTAKLADRVRIWNERLVRYGLRIDEYDALPGSTPEGTLIAALRAAEIIISTRLEPPTPLTATDYRAALDDKRDAFIAKRNALQSLVDVPRATIAALLSDTSNELPLTAIDPDAFDLAGEDAEVIRFRTRLSDAVARLDKEVRARLDRVDALLTQHDGAAPEDQVKLLQEAAKLLLGEDFQLLPRITLEPATVSEWANAWQRSVSGELTRYLTDTVKRDFPVDDWLHGIARVRDKMHEIENTILLADALHPARPMALTPLQFPYRLDEPWLALELPSNYAIEGERLLYSAHFAEPFSATDPMCGLLVDEWTEVIPGSEETTGIAFHYDRPNCEPPQSWLLALPAESNGTWSWDELLGAVNETLDAAKLRAIEPVHLDATAYSWFLPATTSAYTYPEISISNNLLRNMRIYTDRMTE